MYIDENGLVEFTTKMKTYIDNKFAPEPQEEYFLTFSSPNSFTLSVVDNQKYWDGTLETSTDKTTWTTWSGTSAVNSASDGANYNIFVRGIGNTLITGSTVSNTTCCWRLNGSDISIKGNIENLLDYATVQLGNHPAIANHCFRSLFRYPDSSPNTSIVNVEDLKLPAMTLTDYCYDNMFRNNANLVKSIKELPALTVPQYAYRSMFIFNTSLTTTPIIKATTLIGMYNMAYMFQGCTSLTTAPSLPATNLGSYCYQCMFKECSSLITLPKLPATVLPRGCYEEMFNFCSNIKVSDGQKEGYINSYRIPYYEDLITEDLSLYKMFYNTGDYWYIVPNRQYYTSNDVV